MDEYFVDTSGFYAWLVRSDPAHDAAKDLFEQVASRAVRLVSCDYVLDETVTLLGIRGHRSVARQFLNNVFSSPVVTMVWANSERFRRATGIFNKYTDKGWSFTDCMCLALMDERGIDHVITTDHHFEQAGRIALLR